MTDTCHRMPPVSAKGSTQTSLTMAFRCCAPHWHCASLEAIRRLGEGALYTQVGLSRHWSRTARRTTHSEVSTEQSGPPPITWPTTPRWHFLFWHKRKPTRTAHLPRMHSHS